MRVHYFLEVIFTMVPLIYYQIQGLRARIRLKV